MRKFSSQQEVDRDVWPERSSQLFCEDAASIKSVPGHMVPSQQRERTLHGFVQV